MTKKKFNPIMNVEDDGLVIPEVGVWSIEKYQLLGGYCDIFTRGMRKLWSNLIYIDLYTGAGYSRIRDNNQILKSSPLIALSVPVKFNKYIFCEEDSTSIDALSQRIQRENSGIPVQLIEGDCNVRVDDIKNAIPKYSKSNTVLAFCFSDPYDLDLNFSTIEELAEYLIDFLILEALHMDANRNFNHYMDERSEKINSHLGDPNWRIEWENSRYLSKDFVKFLAFKYDKKMRELGYLPAYRHQIRLPVKNVPLYYLTFYSKHERGLDFFKKVDEYATPQLSLGV